MIQLRAVGAGAVGPCQHPDCQNTIQLVRSSCCGGGPGGGKFGCGQYYCVSHLPHIFEEERFRHPILGPRPPHQWPLCEPCFEELEAILEEDARGRSTSEPARATLGISGPPPAPEPDLADAPELPDLRGW